MTPATTFPSCPANSPKVSSSSASRRRCRMTWPAVVAAIRPKPAGVSSYSRSTAPFSSVSAAHTVTCPDLRSTSTRAVGAEPSVLWYATSSASSMARITRSIEMSFSASRLLRTDTSMSIPILLVRGITAEAARLAEPAELDLHPARPEIGVAEPEHGDDRREGRRRDGEVEQAPWVPADRLAGHGDRLGQRLGVVGVGGAEAEPALERLPGRAGGAGQAELGDRGPGVGAELVLAHREPRGRGADHPVPVGQQAGLGQVEQAGQQLAPGQVAGRAEQHDDVVVGAGVRGHDS